MRAWLGSTIRHDTQGHSKNPAGDHPTASARGPRRRSYQEAGAKAPIHMISAFSSRQRMVLGQRKVADKSNEITAIPELLDLLTVKAPSSPSMRWAASARSRLALKGNQGSLRDDVELFFTEQKERRFADAAMSPYSQWTGFEARHLQPLLAQSRLVPGELDCRLSGLSRQGSPSVPRAFLDRQL